MANNRYYIKCPVCRERWFFAKSLGDGLYNMAGVKSGPLSPANVLNKPNSIFKDDYEKSQSDFLEGVYEWVWPHMLTCHGDEFTTGTLFTIESEYPDA